MARILVVEDDPDVRPLLVDVLAEADHEVDAAATVGEGLALLGSCRYDLVLADGRLQDGFGTLVADKAREQGVGTLILTGLAHELLDCYDVLLKPVRPGELLAAVRRSLAKARCRGEDARPSPLDR